MKFDNYTIDDLVNDCPKSDKVDMNKIKEMLENIFDNCEYYQEIFDYFKTYISKCLPIENCKWDSPEYDEYYKYMNGDDDNNYFGFYQVKGFNKQGETYRFGYKTNNDSFLFETSWFNNPLDAAFEIVCWLKENNKI